MKVEERPNLPPPPPPPEAHQPLLYFRFSLPSHLSTAAAAAVRARTNEARKRQTVRDEAASWHARCKEQEHRTLKWKKRVLAETQYFNGRALTGQYQRYKRTFHTQDR